MSTENKLHNPCHMISSEFPHNLIVCFLVPSCDIVIMICLRSVAWVGFRSLLSYNPFFGLPRSLHTNSDTGDSFLLLSSVIFDLSLIIHFSVITTLISRFLFDLSLIIRFSVIKTFIGNFLFGPGGPIRCCFDSSCYF